MAALVLIIDLAAIPCAGPSGAMTALLVAVFGWSSWSVPVLQQHRLAEAAPDSAGLLISLNASFLYLGAATAGAVGAMSLRLWGPAWLGPLSAAFVFAGLLVSPRAHHAR